MTRNVMVAGILGAWLLASGLPASAEISEWGAGAGAGTVDEASTELLALGGFNASFQAGKAGTATIRYTVPLMDAFRPRLTASLRHSSANDRIVVRLRKLDLATGVVTTELTLDTDLIEPSPQLQQAQVGTCNVVFPPPASGVVFQLEVTLTRTQAGGTTPVFAGFGIAPNPDCIF